MVFDYLSDLLGFGSKVYNEAGDLPWQTIGSVANPAVTSGAESAFNLGSLGNFGLSDFGKAAQVGGTLLSAFDQPEFTPQVMSGAASSLQPFFDQYYAPALMQQAQADYVGRPMRRAAIAGDADFDPVFGSYGISDLQQYMDSMAATAGKPEAPAASNAGNGGGVDAGSENVALPLNDMGDGRYMSKSGIMLSGENAKAAAEAEAMQALFGTPQNGTSWASTAFAGGDNTGSNQFTGAQWDKNAALQALMAGDKSGYMEQAGRKMYDPRVSGFGKFVEMAKPFIVGAALAPVGGAFGGALGGATGSATLASLGKIATNRALGSAFSG
jgi:hypothetical protein